MNQEKILVIIGSLMIGGTETFLVRYISFLSSLGGKIELCTFMPAKGPLAQELKKTNIIITSLLNDEILLRLSKYPQFLIKTSKVFICFFKLFFFFRKNKTQFSTIHFFLPEAYLLGMIAAKLSGFKAQKVMSRRSLNYYQQKRPFMGWLERRMHRFTTIVIGNSSPVIAQLQEEGVTPEKLRLIYNGLDVKYLEMHFQNTDSNVGTKIRQDLKLKSEDLVFIIVANLIPYKGHQDLLQAFHLIKNKLPQSWKLLCVGRDQGIADNLKKWVQDYQIQANVLWLGERNDVPALLQIADIGILCSHEEGFSNAVLEGMAAGLPMVVTNVGGNAEAVIAHETGYVVPAKNPEALSDALLALALDKQKRATWGEKAKQRVMQHFTLEKCVEQHRAVYEELNKKLNENR